MSAVLSEQIASLMLLADRGLVAHAPCVLNRRAFTERQGRCRSTAEQHVQLYQQQQQRQELSTGVAAAKAAAAAASIRQLLTKRSYAPPRYVGPVEVSAIAGGATVVHVQSLVSADAATSQQHHSSCHQLVCTLGDKREAMQCSEPYVFF